VIEMPVVDQEKCNGCGLCVSVCYCNALTLIENIIYIVETEQCCWCTECEAVCPTGAITCPFEIIIEPRTD
jgi:MinD superfamily P-loop ATPase